VRTWEFLDYSGKLAGVKDSRLRAEKVEEYLNKVGLFDARDRFANKLSGGMKRRLGIAQAFIGEPAILIVDEPTTGLDPEERIRFRNLLSDMARGERIIILSTHIVGDISSTCNDLAIIHDGQLGFSGSPDVLIEQARGKTWRCEAGDAELEKIKLKHEIIATIPAENGWMVEFVSQRKPRFTAKEMEPTIEHAYVNFMQSRNLEIEEDGWTDE
jgi:ABC-type multidrug transport system ATPase subunit